MCAPNPVFTLQGIGRIRHDMRKFSCVSNSAPLGVPERTHAAEGRESSDSRPSDRPHSVTVRHPKRLHGLPPRPPNDSMPEATMAPVGNTIGLDAFRSSVKKGIRLAATATSALRSGPDLVIIGVKRGGTTSLFRDLERHAAMCPLVPSARRLPLRENQKGVHYFDTAFSRGDRWYRSHFPTRFVQQQRARSVGASFTAEASPYYFFQPLAARRVAAALPDAHFVLLLRDPVERTVSHWSEQTRNGIEGLSLAEAIDAEPDRVGAAAEQLAAGEIETSNAHEQQSYVAQSLYADSLQRWFDAVGPDRITVAFSEDYYQDPAAVIATITDRLGLGRMPTAATGEHRNAAPRASSIDPETERQLIERFAPDVAEVAALLGKRPPWPRFGLEPTTSAADTTL